ncbi:META domain-containing protein [Tepidamorphus sp. 3E244]|uniref:META domain-containing protein n=1 Tax=Tepidamorphus sp. 3E244 TaxID=3385498 RepID=UPI0038FC115D
MTRRKFTAMILTGTALASAAVIVPHTIAAGQAGAFRLTAFQQLARDQNVMTEDAMSNLSGEWQLTHLASYGAGLNAVDESVTDRSQIVIGPDGAFNGTVGCNRFGTSFDLKGEAIAFDGVMSTRKACQGPVWDAERNLFAALNRADTHKLEGGVLTLLDAAGNEIARFTRT